MSVNFWSGLFWDFFIILIYLLLFLFRNKISNKFKSNKNLEKWWNGLKDSCKIRYNNIYTSILLPIVLVLIYWLVILSITNSSFVHYTGFYELFSSVFLAPFSEEVIFRGILLGLFVIFSFDYFTVSTKFIGFKKYRLPVILFGLLIISLFFSLQHAGKIDLRYLGGLLFGILYLVDKRNLLPAMIGHFVNNVIAFLI
ncbi:MAG: CPBP family intramembrane glutamic endopeptidase [Candidatus Woesearchaeota archaeon]